MNKVLIKLFLPAIDKQYDIWLPLNRNIYNSVLLLIKGVNELNDNIYQPRQLPSLYNKSTGKCYNWEWIVKDTDIKNGTELILM